MKARYLWAPKSSNIDRMQASGRCFYSLTLTRHHKRLPYRLEALHSAATESADGTVLVF
jgi:hypothetical protein